MEKYTEIRDLYLYCASIGYTKLKYQSLLGGHQIIFPNGTDVVQHDGSYGRNEGCVEFAGLHDDIDYTAVPLEDAKHYVKIFMDELMVEKE